MNRWKNGADSTTAKKSTRGTAFGACVARWGPAVPGKQFLRLPFVGQTAWTLGTRPVSKLMARHNASSTGEAKKKKEFLRPGKGKVLMKGWFLIVHFSETGLGLLQQIIAGSLPLTFLIPNLGEKENSTWKSVLQSFHFSSPANTRVF